MTDFQKQVYLMLCMSNRGAEAEAYREKCESDITEEHGMMEPDARKKAEIVVFGHMGLSDIERECECRGIKVTKNRGQMEIALIEALTSEYVK